MSDHRAEYLAAIDEYRKLAPRTGMPCELSYGLDVYMAASAEKRAAMLVGVEQLVKLVRKLLADVAAVEPEPDWREAFELPLRVNLMSGGRDAWLVSHGGKYITGCPVNDPERVALYRYIAECVNAAEAKRGKACCICCERTDSCIFQGGIGPFCASCSQSLGR